MEGMTRATIPWRTKADQVTLPAVVAEIATYIDASVKT